jgi:AcrR family transcriptional regulator
MIQSPTPSPPNSATAERLVVAAGELIAEIGWGSVSTRRVAERAGLNPGLVHYHFSSVDELRRVAAVRGVREFFEEPVEQALSHAEGSEAISALLTALSPAGPSDPRLNLLHESLVAANRDEWLRREIAGSITELRGLLTSWLTARAVNDPEAIAVTITTAIDGYLLQRSLDPSLEPGPLIRGLSRLLR